MVPKGVAMVVTGLSQTRCPRWCHGIQRDTCSPVSPPSSLHSILIIAPFISEKHEPGLSVTDFSSCTPLCQSRWAEEAQRVNNVLDTA